MGIVNTWEIIESMGVMGIGQWRKDLLRYVMGIGCGVVVVKCIS